MYDVKLIEKQAKEIRRLIVKMIGRAQSGHPGGSLSCADLVSALYFGVMNVDPKDPAKVLSVYKEPLIAPDTPLETDEGFRENVIFPCRTII